MPFSPVSCWITGGSHSSTPSAAPVPIHPSSDRRAGAIRPALAQTPREPHAREPAQPAREPRVRDVGLQAEARGEDEDGQRGEVVAPHRPHRDEEDEPPHHREVRVPRLGEDVRPVEREQRGRARRPTPTSTGVPPRRRAIQSASDAAMTLSVAVAASSAQVLPPNSLRERGEGPEAQRAGMAPLLAERADAAGQPDERRIGAEHVAHPQRGVREVERREPRRVGQGDERDDERDRAPPRPVPPAATRLPGPIVRGRRAAVGRPGRRRGDRGYVNIGGRHPPEYTDDWLLTLPTHVVRAHEVRRRAAGANVAARR